MSVRIRLSHGLNKSSARCASGALAVIALAFGFAVTPNDVSAQVMSFAPAMSERGDAAAFPDAAVGDTDSAVLPERLKRTTVAFDGHEAPGTVVIDTGNTYLYYVLGGGRAVRYGVGVGRQGFTWSGIETVSRKAEWPDWIPPAEMIARQPYLPRWVAGGPGNPLGARAMYLGNSTYRIHGTNDPTTIGKFVSSGCIRMTNDDVVDLFARVQLGARVVVLSKRTPDIATSTMTRPVAHRVSAVVAVPDTRREARSSVAGLY